MAKSSDVQCPDCKHYLVGESSAGCSVTALKLVKKMYVAVEGESDPSFDINKYKFACKIISNDPSEFDKIDPRNCKYFLSKKLTFFLG